MGSNDRDVPRDVTHPLRVLLVEDSNDDTRLIVHQLERAGYTVQWEQVETAEGLGTALTRQEWDLVLADCAMPCLDAPSALAIVQASGRDIPFIVVSGTIREETAVAMMRQGAHDYLDKDSLGRLIPAVQRELRGAEERRQRKRAEEALEESQDRIREQAALLDEIQDAIFVVGPEGRFRYCNRSAERFHELPSGQLLKQDAAEVLFPENRGRFAEVCQATLERRSWSEEIRHTTPLGARRVVLSRWRVIPREGDPPSSFLIVNTDVTEQKRWEEQFLRAQRAESIGILASGIAHDLKNVLVPITMASGFLRRLAKDNDALQIIAMIEESARRGSQIIQQLLTFGRGIGSQKVSLRPGSLLQEVAKVARCTFPKNIKVEEQVPDNLWFVHGDPTQICQVLLNLCVNARDAMSSGGTLSVSAENLLADADYAAMNSEAKPGPYVVLQIADTGAGIPPDTLDKIFDPFFTTKEPGKGTGLGLASALAIVRGHGGFIQVNIRLGEGTRFKVYLPALPPS